MKRTLLAICSCVCVGMSAFADLVYPAATGTQYLTAPLSGTTKVKLEGVTDLEFSIAKAVGIGNIAGMEMHAYLEKTVDGERVAELQVCDDVWVKCVRVIFSQEADGIYVRQNQAYYYRQTAHPIGTLSWDDYGDGTGDVMSTILYGVAGGTPYGVQELWLTYPEVRTTAFDGKLVVGEGVELTLKDAAAAGTIPNEMVITNARVTLYAEQNVNYSGLITGEQGALSLATKEEISSQELAQVEQVTDVSEPTALTSDFVLLFSGAKLDDLVINEGEVTQGTNVITGHVFYASWAEDRKSVTYELQAQNTSDNWVKCARITLEERIAGVFGKKLESFYYTGMAGHPEKEGTKTYANLGSDSDIRGGGYGVGKLKATFTRYPSEEFDVNIQGFVDNQNHKWSIVARGYDLKDLQDVQVFETKNMLGTSSKCVSELMRTVPSMDGVEYQYQVKTSDNMLKCICFHLVQTAENDIVGYITRACVFNLSTRTDVAFGDDITNLWTEPENEYRSYCITKLRLRFARTAVPAAVITLSGTNTNVSGSVIVKEGARAHLVTPVAMPEKQALDIRANAKVTLEFGKTSDRAYILNAAKGAEVTVLGRLGVTVNGTTTKEIHLDGATMRIMGNHEYPWDGGDYITKIELKNGALLSGYSPRGNDGCQLIVSGTGCATNNAGVMLGMASATTYRINVADTTGDAAVDLEFSGPLSAHGQAQKGGICKRGEGTMRLTSRYLSMDPWTQLDAGTLIVGRSHMWSSHRLVVKGGALVVEAGVTDNSVAGLELQGAAELTLDADAQFDLGDVSAKTWAEGATLSVTMPKSAVLAASAITSAQLSKIRINGSPAKFVDGKLLPHPRGTYILIQ